MASKQRTWGQYATPIDVADLLLGFCLRRPGDRLLDPSCGDGALLRRAGQWQGWLSSAAGAGPADALVGIELDPEAAARAETVAGANILRANFFTLDLPALNSSLATRHLPPATPHSSLETRVGNPRYNDLPALKSSLETRVGNPRYNDLPALKSSLETRVGNPRYNFDAVVGNPPYTRAEWIRRVGVSEGQLPLFPDAAGEDEGGAGRPLLPRELSAALGRRAGLHAYFFLHSLGFLRPGGRLGFVVPNGWLDVAYGAALKRFLLDNYRVLAVIESSVERWFEKAEVNTCVVILERAEDAAARAANRTRLVRLRRPLYDLLGHDDGPQRVAAVEGLLGRLLPAADRHSDDLDVRVCEQGTLVAEARWGELLRAPDVVLRHAPAARPAGGAPEPAPLGQWATIQRGVTTGANNFFYLDPQRVADWGIEAEFRRPLLKSLRDTGRLHVGAADCHHELLLIPRTASLAGTRAGDYLADGEARGIARRRTCAGRRPWYVLPEQPQGALLIAKGVWQRHFAALADDAVVVDQQIYRLCPAEGLSPAVVAALLNSAWFALQCELRGRVVFGDGVLWLATYELAGMPLPDPRALDAARRAELEACFTRLAAAPLSETAGLSHPDRRALDELVFDLLGLTVAEREAARTALGRCLAERRERAGRVAHADAGRA